MTKADTTVERIGGYRVVRRLATGGTSDVLLAKAEGPLGFERTVVLKLLLSQFRGDDEFARMFAREASAYARLSHPSIVRLFDFFAVPVSESGAPARQAGREGQLCMVLEHIDGPPLTRLRTMLKGIGRELDDRAAIYVAARIFDALAAAHSAVDESGAIAPVIHRDVNPSNVLVPWDGHVKLADFGVAKVTGLSHQSVAGMIKGTYGYMAPEQVTGEAISPRADVYAGGIILWELLTKRRAFQRGALPEVEALRAMAEPRLVGLDTIRPDLDRTVRDAVKRALEPRAERRTITAEEMVAVLTAVVRTDEGRERLVSALNVVRTGSQPSMAAATVAVAGVPAQLVGGKATETLQAAVAPPANPPGAVPPAAGSSGRRGSPKAVPPPLPPSVPRMTAARAAADGPPKNPSQTALPRTTPGSDASPIPPKVPSRTALPASAAAPEPPRRPSASMRLANAVPDPPMTSEGPSTATLSLFDSLVEPPDGIHRGMALTDAIDAVLREQPSSMPPSILQTEPPSRPDGAPDATPLDPVRGIGQFPAAPPPLQPAPPSAQDFGATVRELVEKAEAPTVVPPPELAPPPPPMPVGPPPLPLQTHTLAMEKRPEGTKPQDAPTARGGGAANTTTTGRMAPYVPPAAYRTPVPPALPGHPSSGEPAWPARDSGQPTLVPPMPSTTRRSVGAIVAVLVFAVVAGGAGVVGYVRYQASNANQADESGASPATAVASLPSATAVTLASASAPLATAIASAAPSANPAPSADASVAGVVATASASPPASASSASTAPSARLAESAEGAAPRGDIPEGMGIVTTTGTVPGRRIFVDEKTLGQTPQQVTVKCGPHIVRLGSSGKPQSIDVPCGGEIAVSDKF